MSAVGLPTKLPARPVSRRQPHKPRLEERMSDELILFERSGRVATVTINRPEKMNALTAEMMARLQECWSEVRDNDGIWVAVITGAGERAFCSGRDLMAGAPGGPEWHRARKAAGL